jgi:hypothetical protein
MGWRTEPAVSLTGDLPGLSRGRWIILHCANIKALRVCGGLDPTVNDQSDSANQHNQHR